jgi:hypothetical protein
MGVTMKACHRERSLSRLVAQWHIKCFFRPALPEITKLHPRYMVRLMNGDEQSNPKCSWTLGFGNLEIAPGIVLILVSLR